MVPKSPKIEPWGPQNVVKKSNLFLYRFRDIPHQNFLPFLHSFWDPKEAQIGTKTWKRRWTKIVWFFHWFYDGLGLVFQRFFNGFLKSKFHGSLESDFVKKLTKHWPRRQNQGSAFYNFSKNLKKYENLCVFGDFDFRPIPCAAHVPPRAKFKIHQLKIKSNCINSSTGVTIWDKL